MKISRNSLKQLVETTMVEVRLQPPRETHEYTGEREVEREFFGDPLERSIEIDFGPEGTAPMGLDPVQFLDGGEEEELLKIAFRTSDKYGDITYRALFVEKDPIAIAVYNRFKKDGKNIFGNEKEFLQEYWGGPEATAQGQELFKQAITWRDDPQNPQNLQGAQPGRRVGGGRPRHPDVEKAMRAEWDKFLRKNDPQQLREEEKKKDEEWSPSEKEIATAEAEEAAETKAAIADPDLGTKREMSPPPEEVDGLYPSPEVVQRAKEERAGRSRADQAEEEEEGEKEEEPSAHQKMFGTAAERAASRASRRRAPLKKAPDAPESMGPITPKGREKSVRAQELEDIANQVQLALAPETAGSRRRGAEEERTASMSQEGPWTGLDPEKVQAAVSGARRGSKRRERERLEQEKGPVIARTIGGREIRSKGQERVPGVDAPAPEEESAPEEKPEEKPSRELRKAPARRKSKYGTMRRKTGLNEIAGASSIKDVWTSGGAVSAEEPVSSDISQAAGQSAQEEEGQRAAEMSSNAPATTSSSQASTHLASLKAQQQVASAPARKEDDSMQRAKNLVNKYKNSGDLDEGRLRDFFRRLLGHEDPPAQEEIDAREAELFKDIRSDPDYFDDYTGPDTKRGEFELAGRLTDDEQYEEARPDIDLSQTMSDYMPRDQWPDEGDEYAIPADDPDEFGGYPWMYPEEEPVPIPGEDEESELVREDTNAVSQKISYLKKKEKKPHDQAIAIALSMEERGELEEHIAYDRWAILAGTKRKLLNE